MTDKFVNFETPVCADWLNQVDRTTFVALGSANTVDEAREVLEVVGWTISANLTLHVAVNGNDATGDGSASAPWASIARALEYLAPAVIAPAAKVTIQLGAGDFLVSGVLSVLHPYGARIFIQGATPVGAITGIVQADFTAPLTPVPGTRGAYDLYNSAGMLATNADAAARTAARAVDAPLNLALLRSVYPTRLVSTGAQFDLQFNSVFGGLQDLLIVGGRVRVNSCAALTIGTTLAITGSTAIAMLVQAGGILTCNRLIATNTGTGIRVQQDASAQLVSLFAQGCSSDGIAAQRSGICIIAEAICTGCGAYGLYAQLSSLIIVDPTASLKKEVSITGNGSIGAFFDACASFTWNFNGGTGGNFMRIRGNAASQLTLANDASVNITASSATVSVQGSTTNSAVNVINNSTLYVSGSVGISAGQVSVQSAAGGFAVFTGPLTITDAAAPVLQRPFIADGGLVQIRGTLSVPAALGSLGVQAVNGGRVVEIGAVLAGLAVSSPTKFSPLLGVVSSKGSQIASGAETS